jgi:hypothetical protein
LSTGISITWGVFAFLCDIYVAFVIFKCSVHALPAWLDAVEVAVLVARVVVRGVYLAHILPLLVLGQRGPKALIYMAMRA